MSIANELMSGETAGKVEHLLKNHPTTRDSDRWLLIAYLAIFHGMKNKMPLESWNALKKAILEGAAVESLTRARRKIQEAGMYLATEETRNQRVEAEEGVRQWSRE